MNILLMPRITFYEREKIEVYLRMGRTKKWIAKRLNRDYSVIKREVTRNNGMHFPYIATTAQRIFEQRKVRKNRRKLEKPENKALRWYVISKLKEEQWSPEEIAGRIKQDNLFPNIISHESIYDYIYNGEGKFEYLYPCLRTKRHQRQRRFNRRKRAKISIKDRISIHERPGIIDDKERIGDWETDSLIFSQQKPIISCQYERKSMLCRLHKVKSKEAKNTEDAIWDSVESLPYFLWQSITRDNGTENILHTETKNVFNIQSYFCDAYSSWQKGGVENLNKLIRQYLPKKTNISTITNEDIYVLQEKLNNRPRKRLNYSTPNEVIAEEIKRGH